MAGRLSNLGSRILGGNGIVNRSIASSLRLRSGMGLPVGKHIVPDKPLPADDELTWDNGTPFPEPCIDRIAETVGKYEALGWLCGGLGFFASLGLLAVWNDKASTIPFVSFLYWALLGFFSVGFGFDIPPVGSWLLRVPKVYPYDNLRVELGGEPEA